MARDSAAAVTPYNQSMSAQPVLLGVCYDKAKLNARLDVLVGTQIAAIPASSRERALEAIDHAHVDILVFCAGMPTDDRRLISAHFKRVNGGPVLWVMNSKQTVPAELADGSALEDSPEDIREAVLALLAAAHKKRKTG